jgi:hypothetical protein
MDNAPHWIIAGVALGWLAYKITQNVIIYIYARKGIHLRKM